MEAQGLVPCLQESATDPYPEADESSLPFHPIFLRSILILSSHPHIVLRSFSSLQVFRQKFCTHFSSLIRTTSPAHLILLDAIALIILDEACKL